MANLPKQYLGKLKDRGVWGQFDPFRVGDAASFEFYGGDQDTYAKLTDEQFGEYQWMMYGMSKDEGGVHPLVKQGADELKAGGYTLGRDEFRTRVMKKWLEQVKTGKPITGSILGDDEGGDPKLNNIDLSDPSLELARKNRMKTQGVGRAASFLTGANGTTGPVAKKTLLGGW